MGDMSGESTPLLLRGEKDGRRVAVLAFDLRHSDLALQPAFPLLWVNLINWLAPGLRSEIPPQIAPGANISFTMPIGAEKAVVTRPDQSTIEIQAKAGGQAAYTDTGQLGLYKINFKFGDGEEQSTAFAVNLYSSQESDIRPASTLPGLDAEAAGVSGSPLRGMREYWRLLTLFALGLLLSEWMIYQRAGLARLRDWVLRR
jgi:hypothetical protein